MFTTRGENSQASEIEKTRVKGICEVTGKNAIGGWKGVLQCGVQSVVRILQTQLLVFSIGFASLTFIFTSVNSTPIVAKAATDRYASCSRES